MSDPGSAGTGFRHGQHVSVCDKGGPGRPEYRGLRLSSLAAALMGLWYGVRSFMEKDRNYILAKIGISICVVLVIVWAVIIVTGIVR